MDEFSGLDSEALSKTVFSLPMHPYLETDVQEQVVDGILGVLAAQKPGSTN